MATKQVVNEEVKMVIGIPVRHYSNTFKSLSVYQMTEDFGESNTDKSFFRPDLDKARSTLGQMRGSTRVGLYDYPDGKDKGDVIQTVLRSKGLDRAEIDGIQAMLQAKIDAGKTFDKEAFAKELAKQSDKDFSDYLKNISENVTKFLSTSTGKE